MMIIGMGWIKKVFSTKKRIAGVLLLILFFFVGKYFLIDSKKTASNFALVKRDDIKEELSLSGQIDSDDHAILTFGIAGKVNWVGVKEGDWVKEDQAIATLEKEVLNAALREAWSNFTAAKAASEKYYSDHTGNSESYDQKIERTALDAAQNNAYDNVRIAQENLKSAALYSPIEGLVVSVNPNLAGVNVSALNSSYEIVNPLTVYLKVTADQTEVGDIKKGQAGVIFFDSYPDEQMSGKIRDISFVPSKDETGTVYDVKIILSDVNNKDYKYRLGMTADVNFVLKESMNVLIIPSEYIKSDGGKKYVLKGKDKKKIYVETGIENDQDTEIIKGLSEGDIVYD